MEFTAEMIAGYLHGTVEGDPGMKVSTVARIEEGFPGALSFLANMKYEQYIYTTKSSVVFVNRDFRPSAPVSATLIRVEDSYQAFAALLAMYQGSEPVRKGIHPTAVVDESASLGRDVFLGPFVYIGARVIIGDNTIIHSHTSIGDDSRVGNNCRFFSGVVVYHECIIGDGCTLHAGTVIGADGFGFAPQSESEFMKIPQIGNVVIEENVEIGANVCIDRATIGSTIIRKGVKLDNLIQVGHNVEIGENTVIAGQTGIAGSTKIGRNCMFAGQVGVTGHVIVADGTKVGAQAGIAGPVREPGSTIIGSPAMEHIGFMKSFSIFRKLPAMKATLEQLEKKMKKFDNQ